MKKSILFLFTFFFVAFTILQAQSLRIGPTVGLTSFQAPDYLTNDLDEGGWGLSSHINYGAKVKLGLPLLPLTFVGSFVYTPLSSEKGDVEFSSSLTSIGLGAELSFAPGPLSPYAGLDLLYNSFGDTEYKTPDGPQKGDGVSRYGIAIGIGAEFTLLPKVDVDVSAKYNMYNLFGKDDNEEISAVNKDEETISAITINATFYFSVL